MPEPTDTRGDSARNAISAVAAELAELHVARGIALAKAGQRQEAITAFHLALQLHPDHARAHHNLAVALVEEKKYPEALAAFREALRCQPNYAKAHCHFGNTLAELDRHEEAVAAFREALRCQPDYVDALNNLGLALTHLGRSGEATVFLRQAIRLQPDSDQSYNNLGLAHAEQGDFAAAEACYEQALRLNPRSTEAHANLGSAFKEQGRLEEALASYELALALEPDSASCHWNRSLIWLQMGNFEKGWPEYEWRKKRGEGRGARGERGKESGYGFDEAAASSFSSFILHPSSFPHSPRILLHGEQGFGDMIQFLRYVPLIKERGGTVVVAAPAELVSLFATCPGVERVVDETQELPPCDVQVPLMSLPALFKTTLATIPVNVPYLGVEPAHLKRWRQKLESETSEVLKTSEVLPPAPDPRRRETAEKRCLDPSGPFRNIEKMQARRGPDTFFQQPPRRGEGADRSPIKVGIVWQGNPRHKWDRHRSFPLNSMEPLARVDSVTLISLQKGPGAEQLLRLGDRFPVIDLGCDLADFTDTAALVRCLDLVICCDTAIAHLAGALGVPVWLALSTMADWRWLLQREDSPWYPTMRLFRQERLGDWTPVFQRMAAALAVEQASRLFAIGTRHPPKSNSPHPLPNTAAAHNSRGLRLAKARKPAEAALEFQAALALDQSKASYHHNLGAALSELGRPAESLKYFETAVRLNPRHAEAHKSIAMASLCLGDFERGWAEFEWRWQCKDFKPRSFAQPAWDGGSLQGRRILLYPEQGVGDTFQFIRYASVLAERGALVTLESPRVLAPILQTCPGVAKVVAPGETNIDFECHAPLMSLPRLLGTTLQSVPAPIPYLAADEKLMEHWRRELESVRNETAEKRCLDPSGPFQNIEKMQARRGPEPFFQQSRNFKVGVVWQGNPENSANYRRSFPLAQLAALAAVPGVALFSLQKGGRIDQLDDVNKKFPITDLGNHIKINDFAATAAVLCNLDLIVSCDTSTAHLAGALGRPVWLALSFAADWRWLLNREDSPWYPTMRLFRQPKLDGWEAVFVRMAEALRGLTRAQVE